MIRRRRPIAIHPLSLSLSLSLPLSLSLSIPCGCCCCRIDSRNSSVTIEPTPSTIYHTSRCSPNNSPARSLAAALSLSLSLSLSSLSSLCLSLSVTICGPDGVIGRAGWIKRIRRRRHRRRPRSVLLSISGHWSTKKKVEIYNREYVGSFVVVVAVVVVDGSSCCFAQTESFYCRVV